MISQEKIRELLNIYLKENKKSIRQTSLEVQIGYNLLFRFTQGNRRLGFDNFVKLYKYLDNKNIL